jgi:hypothetical protein
MIMCEQKSLFPTGVIQKWCELAGIDAVILKGLIKDDPSTLPTKRARDEVSHVIAPSLSTTCLLKFYSNKTIISCLLHAGFVCERCSE